MIYGKAKCPDCKEWSDFCRKEKPGGDLRCPSCFVMAWIQGRCTHIKGRWAGQDFKLLPWQMDIITQAFGTLKKNGKRQYRTVYVEIPKKCGKSEFASAIAIYGLTVDGEQGGEVYSAAGEREQASLVYYPAAQMVRNNPKLNSRLKIVDSRRRIIDYQTNSFYQVLSSESYSKHGLNPSVIIFDELHAQPNRELWDVLTEGTDVAREQQLIFVITTAGVFDKESIGWQIHDYAVKVQEARDRGEEIDPTFLPVIHAADEKDDWEDEEVWKACNPSFGTIFDIDNLREHYTAAKNDPARLNNFLRFRLNRWVGQVERWLPMDKWDLCGEDFDKEALVKCECYGGLDLSSSIDLTAFVLVFPPAVKGERWKILPKFYIPEDNMLERSKRDRVPYDMWVRAGLITATPGNVVDYGFIRRDVNNAAKIYNLKEVAFDPWGAVRLATDLQEADGITMVEFRQGWKSMSPPMKDLLKMTMNSELQHDGHPVLRWCANNLAVKIDAAENVKPEKDKSYERIDGVVALAMGLGRALVAYEHKTKYRKEGLMIL